MTTLYKPVLIETAEQAEALPEGTLARHAVGPAWTTPTRSARSVGTCGWP